MDKVDKSGWHLPNFDFQKFWKDKKRMGFHVKFFEYPQTKKFLEKRNKNRRKLNLGISCKKDRIHKLYKAIY